MSRIGAVGQLPAYGRRITWETARADRAKASSAARCPTFDHSEWFGRDIEMALLRLGSQS